MVHWWKRERIFAKQGDMVSAKDTGNFLICPQCGNAPVVYNGNYFCDNWSGGCDWALAHPALTTQDRRICDLIGIAYD